MTRLIKTEDAPATFASDVEVGGEVDISVIAPSAEDEERTKTALIAAGWVEEKK